MALNRFQSTGVVRHIAVRGRGYLAGSVPVDNKDGRVRHENVPSRGRITLFDQLTYKLVAQVRADENGVWRIGGLDENREYYAISWDDSLKYEAIVRSHLKPKVA